MDPSRARFEKRAYPGATAKSFLQYRIYGPVDLCRPDKGSKTSEPIDLEVAGVDMKELKALA